MTIQRRILIGHVAFTCLLLAIAVVAFVRLKAAYDGQRGGLYSEFGLSDVELLNDRLQEISGLKWVSRGIGDPSFETAASQRIEESREAYFRVMRRLQSLSARHPARPAPFTANLERIYGPPAASEQPSQPPAPGLVKGSSPNRSVAPTDTHPSPSLPAAVTAGEARAPGDAYSEATIQRALQEIRKISSFLYASWEAQQEDADENTRRASIFVAIVVCVSLPLAAISSIVTIRKIIRPIHRLMDATTQIAGGELNVKIPVAGSDEFARLSSAFNRMSDELAGARRRESDFLAVATHELKTPLACIKAYAGTVRKTLRTGGPESDVDEYLDGIDDEVVNLGKKVSKLLDLGVIEAGQLVLRTREFMSQGFFLMAASAFRPIAAQKKIDFEIVVASTLPEMIKADPDRLRQVISNLLDNAFKYTTAGGRVRFEAREKDGGVEIEIADTGVGIPPDQLSAIFDKYARARSEPGSERAGTGLGLAVARGIVLAHGGTIEAESRLGKGSAFRIHLPTGVPLQSGQAGFTVEHA